MFEFIFFTSVTIGLGLIIYIFRGFPDQPMEIRIFSIFLILLVEAGIIRMIEKKIKPSLNKWLKEVKEWVHTGLSAVVLAFLIMYFVVQAFKIPSGSMKNSLLIGDHLFVNKFIYGLSLPFTEKRFLTFRKIHRRDVVVFVAPPQALTPEEREKGKRKDFIKRCIGLPGDVIRVKGKQLYVNNELQQEPYVAHSDKSIYTDNPRDNFGPIVVPARHYFMMGDNRDESFDSRYWDPLSENNVRGKAWFIYWPLTRIKIIR
ncbi:MAG: signal peptidase I [Elusimicrobiota bacterium]